MKSLLALLCSVSTLSAANASEPQGLFERAWVVSDQALMASYRARPVEFLRPASDSRRNDQLLGRIAFNSPRLLGGQSGRMGLSCASCHINGRDNTHFFVKQISSEPGTADISHSFLSSKGGDATLNSKPIPDLAERAMLNFTARDTPEFTQHLKRLVEIEFDGQPASPMVYAALMVYLQDNDKAHCQDSDANVSRTLVSDWQLIDDALMLLRQPALVENAADRKFLLDSIRAELGVVNRNFGIHPDEPAASRLIQLSRSMAELQETRDEQTYLTQLDAVEQQASQIHQYLGTLSENSAYNPTALEHYLKNSGQNKKQQPE